MRTSNNFDDYIVLAAILGFLVVVVGVSVWWLPQKWEACTRLYDNRPAQVLCFVSK